MDNLLKHITQTGRYGSFGKRVFNRVIRGWVLENLTSFSMETQKSRLVFNLRELVKICFLLVNFIVLFFILDNGLISNIISILFIFTIQFRLIFFFLTLLLSSENIVLTKVSNCVPQKIKEVIICAHYDTKNCLLKKRKGLIRSLLKYNIFAVSRILGSYVVQSNKLLLPCAAFAYLWYSFSPNKSVAAFMSLQSYSTTASLLVSLIFSLAAYALLCTGLIYILTYPYSSTMNNPGADDNSSGVAAALEIARQLDKYRFDFDIKIILFDNEERGLIGSNHYVAKNLKALKNNNAKIINLDCIGRGNDVYIVTDRTQGNDIYKRMSEKLNEQGISYKVSSIDYSDHKPFLQEGLDAISITRYNTGRYLWVKHFPSIDWIHGSEDGLEDIDQSKISQIVNTVVSTVKAI